MSVNKFEPHVLVLPEDDANNDIVNGFLLHHALDARAIQVLSCAGGWSKVRESFESDHVAAMRKFPNRHMILLVDFDENSDRFAKMNEVVPDDINDRVYVIGVWSEPEDLQKTKLGSKERVGQKLATECFDQTRVIWAHKLLQHNAPELDRMTAQLRPILFPSASHSA